MAFVSNEILAQCPINLFAQNGTSGNARCPSTRYRNAQSVYLLTAAELSAAGILNGTTLSGISWNYQTAPGVAGAGNLIVYLENTADATNLKSTTWATAITGMTVAHNATTTLPATAGFFDVPFSGGTPFTYTGGGLYVAFDWCYTTGTLSTTAVAGCNTNLANGLLGAQSLTATLCSTLLTTAASAFRPETRLLVTNNNDAKVDYIYTTGELPVSLSPNHIAQAKVINLSATAFTNLNVTLGITGANTFTDVQTIATLPACSTTTVTFLPFTATATGNNTITVSIPPDNNNSNNSKTVQQNIGTQRFDSRYVGETSAQGVGFNAAVGVVSARFFTNATISLTDVNLQFTTTGLTYKIAIYPDNGGVPSTTPLYIDATDRLTYNTGPADQALTSPVSIPPGNFYVTIQQTGTTNMGLAYATESPLRTGTFHFATAIPPAAWGDLGPTNPFRPLIGAKFCFPYMPDSIFGPTVICPNSTNTFGVLPNPSVLSYNWILPSGWTGVNGSGVITATANASSGIVSIEATYACGVSTAKTLNVTVNPAPTINLTSTNVSCNGAANGNIVVTTNITSPIFTISPTATQSPAGTFGPLAPNTYTVTVADAIGCSTSASATIIEPSLLLASIAPSVLCNGSATVLNGFASGGTTPYTYKWINGSTTSNVSMVSVKDNSIFQENPNNSNGAAPTNVAGRNGSGYSGRMLLAFDVATAIPTGATINTASLALNCSQTSAFAGSQIFFLHKLLEDWGEGTNNSSFYGLGAAAVTGSATWNNAFHNTIPWSSLGGAFNVAGSSSTFVNAVGSYTWTGTQVATDVQNWLNTPSTNFGWLLKGVETANNQAKGFDTRENSVAANRPQLSVNYTLPNIIGTSDTLNISAPGTYTLVVTDANGCTATSTIVINNNALSGDLVNTTTGNTSSVAGTSLATINQVSNANYNYTNNACDLLAKIFNNPSALGNTNVTVNVDATVQTHNGQPFVPRWFQIVPTTNGSADVVFYLTQDDFNDYNTYATANGWPLLPQNPTDAAGIANLRLTKNDNAGLGVNPIVLTPTTVNWNATLNYWEVTVAVSSFSQFHFHAVNPNNAALPVVLSNFKAERKVGKDYLSWKTLSENNNQYFEVQHSSDGKTFTTFDKQNTKAINGTSNSVLNYESINEHPVYGHNYYRLKQVDMDGKENLSAVIDLYFLADGSYVNIYPNPYRDVVSIDIYAANNSDATLLIYDMSGQKVKVIQQKLLDGKNTFKYNLSDLASGVYQAKFLINGKELNTIKLIKE